MSDRKMAGELLRAAERDLSALRAMGDAEAFADEIFGFHVQQAVEKSFKAWLASLGEIYPATHNLARLLAALKTRDADAARFEDLTEYAPFAVALRYADANPGAGPLDRGEALGRVEALAARVRRLMDEARPEPPPG